MPRVLSRSQATPCGYRKTVAFFYRAISRIYNVFFLILKAINIYWLFLRISPRIQHSINTQGLRFCFCKKKKSLLLFKHFILVLVTLQTPVSGCHWKEVARFFFLSSSIAFGTCLVSVWCTPHPDTLINREVVGRVHHTMTSHMCFPQPVFRVWCFGLPSLAQGIFLSLSPQGKGAVAS